jgi:hypothetical protein
MLMDSLQYILSCRKPSLQTTFKRKGGRKMTIQGLLSVIFLGFIVLGFVYRQAKRDGLA